MRLRSTLCALVFAGSLALPAVANPLDQVTVRWEAPADCPDRVALDQELRRDLEGSQAPSVRLMVFANVAQLQSATWQVSILAESNDGKSERTITAHSCQSLIDATSLIIAMLIDPETAAAHARPNDARSETTALPDALVATSNASSPPPVASNARRDSIPSESKNKNRVVITHGSVLPMPSASRMRALGFVGAWAALDSGSLPSVTEAFGGSLGLLYGPWRGETSFGAWLPKNRRSNQSDYPLASGEFGKVAGRARACLAALAVGRFAVGPCAGVELSRLSGKASAALTGATPPYRLVAAADAAALATLRLGDVLAVRLDLDVLIPLKRPTFGYEYQNTDQSLFRPDPVALRAATGIELYFP